MNIWYFLLVIFVSPVVSELISVIAGSSLVAGLSIGLGYIGYSKCIFDCCSELKSVDEIG